jgi:hypothetical protein
LKSLELTSSSVAPHSVDFEFLPLDRYRQFVEAAVFDRLGRPSFFDRAVDLVMERLAARIEEGNLNGDQTRVGFLRLIQGEVRILAREIERRFMRQEGSNCLEAARCKD